MAVYKVPQDVEAADKLLGPLTFKQFIFLMIAAGAALFAWLLFQIQPFMALLPIPFVLIFGGLAVFRREDQPVERYLLSFFNYMLRPRTRIWSTEGHYEHLIITAPRKKAAPDLKQDVEQVHGQLEKLAQIVDTRGWALKRPNVVAPGENEQTASPQDDRLFMPHAPEVPQEVADEEDIMDESNTGVQQIDTLLEETQKKKREEIVQRVQEKASQPKTTEDSQKPQPQGDIQYDPYGAGMSHQKRIDPDGSSNFKEEDTEEKQDSASIQEEPASPPQADNSSDIMELSHELKVSQIADKVNKENQKLQEGEEIQLR